VNSLAIAESDVLLAHHPVGASTGYMTELRGDWPAQARRGWDLSPFAIELSALSESELDGLAQFLDSNPRLPFHYLSIHGPSKGRAISESVLAGVLARLAGRAHAIVMHPDTIQDPRHYRVLGRKLLLENMDARKDDGRTVAELTDWFRQLPDAGFCFDIAHAWSLDPTMAVGVELLDAFRTRLRHLHISSMDPDLHHVSLTETDEELFMPLLQRCLDIPWILEAPPRQY
jgi:hypothetical protein